MELGICTFGELTADPATGVAVTPHERLANLLDEVELADGLGLDVYAVGEHHRPDYLVSAPEVVLGAAAARTERIRLSTGVTVLSSADPVRVFEQFATIDVLSNGRAEIMAGRGSFTESFPLFGYDLEDYDELFAEKLGLLIELTRNERVTWSGRFRSPLQAQVVHPRPVQQPIPIWLAVGGNPQSVVRAATLRLPLMLAIIGGQPARFAPFVELYREAERRSGHEGPPLPVGVNCHGFVADTAKEAADTLFPAWAETMSRIGRERGWPPVTRAQFDAGVAPGGHLVVGDPDQVAAKILAIREDLGHDRFLIQFSVGTVPHDRMRRAIELFATEVAPRVREAVAAPAA
jgi:probable LLM family oxidoreductase